jgi:cold shock CspA family protein
VPAGIITQLVPARRLGFVRPAVGGIPLLFNELAIEGVRFDDLHEGQAVTYVLERDRQGRGARTIHIRPSEPAAGTIPPAPNH